MFPKPNHKRRAPKRGERGKFSKETREAALERDNYLCQMCFKQGKTLHHVFLKSRIGRGVLTNALTLCNDCHTQIHRDNELIEYWINVYADRYGSNFYKDGYDSI